MSRPRTHRLRNLFLVLPGTAHQDQLHAPPNSNEQRHALHDVLSARRRNGTLVTGPPVVCQHVAHRSADGQPIVHPQTVDECRSMLKNMYEGEPFVHVLEEGVVPQTRHVRGSNMCLLSVFPDRIPGRVIVLSAIDNLVKGAAGQAIQNMNILMGYSEVSGLMQQPMFP